jgi:hypothetical protein
MAKELDTAAEAFRRRPLERRAVPRSWPLTRWCSRCARTAGSSTSTPRSRSVSTPRATAKSLASTSRRPRTTRPNAQSVAAQYDRIIDAITDKLPKVADHLEDARADLLAFTAFPKQIWRQIWSNNPQEPCRLSNTTNGSNRAYISASTSSANPEPTTARHQN